MRKSKAYKKNKSAGRAWLKTGGSFFGSRRARARANAELEEAKMFGNDESYFDDLPDPEIEKIEDNKKNDDSTIIIDPDEE